MVSKSDHEEMAKIFRAMDTNNNGKLSKQELQDGYLKYYGRKIENTELKDIFDNVDLNLNGELDFDEFIQATLDT